MSNNISQTFINDIKQWVTLDDQLKQTSKLVKQIRKKKNEVGLEIQGYMEQNEIQDKDINLSDGKIKYYVSKRTCGMSKTYIENSLTLYYNGDATKAQEVINPTTLSKDEVAKGLKEALSVGAANSAANASEKGGFNNNLLIKIPFPEEAQKMRKTLIKVGMQSQVDKFEYVLNEAAEDASNYAKKIFINAVKKMSINDALSILKGNDNADTTYLKNQTSKELYAKFKPVVKSSIEKVNLAKYWSVLAESYNALPLAKEVNTDLENYVTNQAIDGLFILIAKEEKNIRNNPNARVSEILQKVFK